MSNLSLDEIQEEEKIIFGDLGQGEYRDEALIGISSSRLKAQRQLEVSDDSPFSRQVDLLTQRQLKLMRQEKAEQLRKETEEIKSQLDLVRGRLTELKAQQSTRKQVISKKKESGKDPIQETKPQPTYRRGVDSREADDAKFRPLTGKTDCPNCNCDRRNSLCDQCSRLNAQVVRLSRWNEGDQRNKQQQQLINDPDERPIRPAPDRRLATVEVVDDVVVPNRLYTISRSLNDKRTKLAQAIEDLQRMMDQVKQRELRLEEERKVVQQYKNQWKFGPSIGGPSATSRDTLGLAKHNRSYESRLDSSLMRDTKSVKGFQHIESSMKLRQYNTPVRRIQQTPARVQAKNQTSSTQKRSMSLESLNKNKPKFSPPKSQPSVRNGSNFLNGKSSSEVDLSSPTTETIEENLEVDIKDSEDNIESIHESTPDSKKVEQQKSNRSQDLKESDEKIQRLTWIPVFGETEIKTVKRTEPKRKIQIIEPRPITNTKTTPLKDQNPHSVSRRNTIVARPKTSSINKVIMDASRSVRSATQLLEKEKLDVGSKNQVIINKVIHRPNSSPRSKVIPKVNEDKRVGSKWTSQPLNPRARESDVENLVDEANGEISRLEKRIIDQQDLLNKLLVAQEQRVVSPITVSCQSPCCHHVSSPAVGQHRPTSGQSQTTAKSLVNNLKEKLNKTKARLARSLEAEREKYQQLQLKVDSSLRKQSDLEAENELLKKSLGRCIDACLKDISITFESISETLTDSIAVVPEKTELGQTLGTDVLNNAAKLIADNRHLQQMKNHIDTIEQQRRGIFEELSIEKQRNSHLEAELKLSRDELDRQLEANRILEVRLNEMLSPRNIPKIAATSHQDGIRQPEATSSRQMLDPPADTNTTSTTEPSDPKSLSNDTFNSLDMYRQYIESMSPDIEAIRRERKLILSEFDNIKKMLSDMDSS